jgi:MFS family permease
MHSSLAVHRWTNFPLYIAGSIFGRILPSYAADHYGRFNAACVVSLLTRLALLAFWLLLELNTHSTKAQIFAFSAMYDFASGTFISIIMACVADLGPVETLGKRFGVYRTVVGL